MTIQELRTTLSRWGQQHLLQYADELTAAQREQLVRQVRCIDFALLQRLHSKQREAAEDWSELAAGADPPEAFRLQDAATTSSAERAKQCGRKALAAGQVGVILVAGGQGTRLGFPHPKGCYPIGPVSQQSLFHVLLSRIPRDRAEYGQPIPVYVMTSPATHRETLEYFEKQNYFGIPPEEVHIFCQGTMPAVDKQTGRVLLADKHTVALSPDGHGGMLSALQRSGGLEDLRRRGIRHLFYLQVDNPLVRVCDPEFLGNHILSCSEMSTQVVAKRDPRDPMGNVVCINGRTRIIEYCDLNPLPDEIVQRKQPDGCPVFWAGNTAVHALDVEFLARCAENDESLPFHLACKKTPHLDAQGKQLFPNLPNAVKFERFIFDLLPAAQKAVVMEVDRASSFAPLKNAAGQQHDTPESVRRAMIAWHRQLLREAGAEVADAVAVEISPEFGGDVEEVRASLAQLPASWWPRPIRVTSPTYFCRELRTGTPIPPAATEQMGASAGSRPGLIP